MRLLLRLYDPQSGAVRIGGQDLRTLDPDAIRRLIAVVAQDTYLFHGTVEENLRLGRPDATEAELAAAAAAANAHEFITALPDGYHTMIGERGTRLSGGQRQRIAIARALLRDSPILVLDEALSSVDAENEAVIQAALDRLMTGRTTLILAHRLSSVIDADRILVLEDGQVAESGTHAALMARDGPYRRLMGPQVSERRDAADELPDLARADPAAPEESQPIVRALADDAAEIGWPDTIRTLLGFIRPWRGALTITVLCGIGRVATFIGVSVLGALVIGAVRAGRPTEALVIGLLAAAPATGLLHWLESWLAHYMAYQLLADLRIRFFAKLDALAPAYLLKRRSGDLVALATQDVETVEYFYAHTVAPAFVAVLVPTAVLATLAAVAWPLAIALLPFLAYAGASPLRGRRRIDRLASAARGALGELGAHATETIQGLAELTAFDATIRRRTDFMDSGAAHSGNAAGVDGRPDATDRRAGGGNGSRRSCGSRDRGAAGRAWLDRPGNAAAADLDFSCRLPAGFGNRPGGAPACRYHRLDPPAARGRVRPVLITDGALTPPLQPGGSVSASHQCGSPIPGGSGRRWIT